MSTTQRNASVSIPSSANLPTVRTARSPINGAEIPLGAHAGNSGGKPGRSGRPTNEIREMMRAALGDRTGIYSEIADGNPVQRAKVPLAAILPHVVCPNCSDPLQLSDSAALPFIEIEMTVSASPRDRLAALDQLAKYGIGTIKEISVENVRERMRATLAAIQRHTSQDEYLAIIEEVRPLWKD